MSNKKHEFSEDEIKYIIANWGIESTYSMKKRFRCSWDAIAKIGEMYGLKTKGTNEWTDEEVSILKNLACTSTYQEIAKILGKTEGAVYLKANKLKISLKQVRKGWTNLDEEFLQDNWGIMPLERICEELGRSREAVKLKASRMKLGRMTDANIYVLSISDVMEIMSVKRDKILITWKNKGLIIRRKTLTSTYSYYTVSIDNLLLFLKNNLDLWDSRVLEKNIFGEEEDWLKLKRASDLENGFNQYRVWENEEIEVAINLLLNGKTYEEIGEVINRKASAVSVKLRSLNYAYKLSKFWKGEELLYLKNNCLDMTYEDMAKVLKRTPAAVEYKVYELGYRKSKKDE